jgi:hypothetical protein
MAEHTLTTDAHCTYLQADPESVAQGARGRLKAMLEMISKEN